MLVLAINNAVGMRRHCWFRPPPPPAPPLQGGVAEVVPIPVGGAAGSMAMRKRECSANCSERRASSEDCEVVDIQSCGDALQLLSTGGEESAEEEAAFSVSSRSAAAARRCCRVARGCPSARLRSGSCRRARDGRCNRRGADNCPVKILPTSLHVRNRRYADLRSGRTRWILPGQRMPLIQPHCSCAAAFGLLFRPCSLTCVIGPRHGLGSS